jgi:hypothetical protein
MKGGKGMQKTIPTNFADALRLAADLWEENQKLARHLDELKNNAEYPEVLRPEHIKKLLGVSASTITEWSRDPSFPHLNAGRKKGEAVYVLKAEFYEWLKTRRIESETSEGSDRFGRSRGIRAGRTQAIGR